MEDDLIDKNRPSFYSWLPAGSNKSAGFFAQISCEPPRQFRSNLACFKFTVTKSVVLCHLKTKRIELIIYKVHFPPSDTIFYERTL